MSMETLSCPDSVSTHFSKLFRTLNNIMGILLLAMIMHEHTHALMLASM